MQKNDLHMSRLERNNRRNSRRNKRKKRRWIVRILLLLLLVVTGFGAYTYFNLSDSIKNGFKKSNSTEEVDPNFEKFSMLVMGIDENDARAAEGQTRENSRTDSIIYMAVNKNQKRMDMVSIPRDSLTLMREKSDNNNSNAYFFDKITHAHAYGGTDGTIDAVTNLVNAPVNFYVIINFKAFEKVIDSLGGVELYVPFDMVEQNANGEEGTVELKKGWHTLNGEQALAFARSRYYDSDIERGQRQLQVIHAVIDKAQSINALAKVNELIQIGGDNVTHNMTMKQITSAVSMFASNDINIVSHRLGGYDAMINDVYYYYPKSSHLQYISSVLNNTLERNIPLAGEILNIHYQGYIIPLSKNYNKNTSVSPRGLHTPVNYVTLVSEDLLQNLPDKLTTADLAKDPTVSNENKPE
ncbi:LCP family protein [Gemella sp. GH3]|uniref:LCP family protein n=1 Tax=unclassified Gemella TaxID=2624949 RepID=UPI0015CF866A|nr:MULTISPECIES: LCP family protein [unclassified Gemella]MBF0713925.1 LCP family protein [Gemella sp. GH3.1]NYS50877.1 LCP family protein [Gemella sp. GH3]